MKAEAKYHREPRETGPPFGWADLPGHIDSRIESDGIFACSAPPYFIERAFTWRDDHPRDAKVRTALTGSLPEYEVGLRVAAHGLDQYDLSNDLGQAKWRRWGRYRNPVVRYVTRRRSSASST